MPTDNVIRFRSAEEFQSRPAWQDGLDHTAHKLLRIIGDYSFSAKEQLPCGLKGCRTAHQNGYIVETVDGLETHIGGDCGKRYFNVNWGDLKATFKRAEEDRDRQAWLDGVLSQREELLIKAKVVLQMVAAASANVDEIIEKIDKESAIKSAFLAAARSGGAVQVERKVDAEIAAAMNLTEKQRTTLEIVGRIEGVDVAIVPQNAKRSLGAQAIANIKIRVLQPLNALSATSLRHLNPRQRKERAKELEQAKELLANTEDYVRQAHRFLLPANLRQIAKLSIYRSNQRVERILKQFGTMAD